MRQKIIAGNWKMNKTLDSGVELTKEILNGLDKAVNSDIVLAVPFPLLSDIGRLLSNRNSIQLAAQNIYPKDEGAFTGEVSGPMLDSSGVDYVIVGHSERREYFQEDNSFIAKKLQYSIASGLQPILCIGESLEVRDDKKHEEFVLSQLEECLSEIDEDDVLKLVIAYEPIWAIGTGRTATPEQAQKMHAAIRKFMATNYDAVGENIPILYGGSMKPANAESLLECDDIDGGLIGGASLQSESFLSIIEIAENLI